MSEKLGSIYSEFRISLAKLKTDVAAAEAELRRGAASVQKLTEEASKSATKAFTQVSESLRAVGMKMTAAGVVAGAGLGYMTKVAMDFGYSVSRVGSLAQATQVELKKLRDEAKRLGATTVYSAKQASDAMQFLAQSGFKTSEIIAAMPGLLDAAAAGAEDLANTADIVSSVLMGFGLAAKESGRVADVLTQAQVSTNVALMDLGESMKYVAPVARTLGISLEETAAAVGLMGNAGIKGSQAGTTLRMALLRLVKPPRMARAEMEKMGLVTIDAQGKMLPMVEILRRLREGTEGWTQAQKAASFSKIFGIEAVTGMMALIEGGSEAFGRMAKMMELSGGTAERIAKQQLDNLKGTMVQLSSAAEGVAIAFGEKLEPTIRWFADQLTKLLSWYNSLSTETQKIVAVTAALGTGLLLLAGPLLLVIGYIPNIVAGMAQMRVALIAVRTAFQTTAASIGPVGWVLLALSAALAVGIPAWQKYKQAQEEAADSTAARIAQLKAEKDAHEAQIDTYQAGIGALEQLGEEYAVLKDRMRDERLSAVESEKVKMRITEIEKILAGAIGEEAVARIRNAKDTRKAIGVEVDSLQIKLQAEQAALEASIKAEDEMTLHKIEQTRQRIKAIESESKAYSIQGKFFEKMTRGVMAFQRGLLKFGRAIGDENLVVDMEEQLRRNEQLLEELYGKERQAEIAKLNAEIRKLQESLHFKEGASEQMTALAGTLSDLGDELDEFEDGDMSSLFGDIGKQAKAANDALVDLGHGLDVIRAKYELAMAQLGENATAEQRAAVQAEYLTAAKAELEARIAKVTEAYQQMVAAKGVNAEESRALELQLLQEKKALAELGKEFEQAGQAMTDFGKGMDVLRVEFERDMAVLDVAGSEVERYQRKMAYLAAAQVEQASRVSKATRAYEAAVRVYGETSAEARDYLVTLRQEEKALAELAAEVDEANRSFEEQKKAIKEIKAELDDYKDRLRDVEEQMADDLAQARKDYLDQVRDINQELADEEKRLTDEYKRQVDDRAAAIYDWVGLFETVPEMIAMSSKQLIGQLQGQVNALQQWRDGLEELAGRGISEELLRELEEMGPAAAGQILSLTQMTDEELAEFQALWEQKWQLANQTAADQMAYLWPEVEAQIQALKDQTAAKLQEYKAEWERNSAEIRERASAEIEQLTKRISELEEELKTKNQEVWGSVQMDVTGAMTKIATTQEQTGMQMQTSNQATLTNIVGQTKTQLGILQTVTSTQWSVIRTTVQGHLNAVKQTFEDQQASAYGWGRNLMSSFIAGIESKYGALIDTLQDIADAIDAYLGFESPTEKGPGRFVEDWGPNMMASFIKGIESSLPDLERIARIVGEAMVPTGQFAVPALATGSQVSGTIVQVDVHDNIFQDGTEAGNKILRVLRRFGK